MRARWSAMIVTSAAALGLAAWTLIPGGSEDVYRVDFGEVVTPTEPTFAWEAPEPRPERVKEFRIPVTHETIEIADGVAYEGWTFGGTVPGPVMRVREGDRVRITLVNESPMGHSIDFHSARIPWNEAYKNIDPGEELTFEWIARDPGVYVVHCGTPPVTMHIMQGMYLAIIVDPAKGWGTKADREVVLVQSEFYAGEAQAGASRQPDYAAAMEKRASHVVFNGRAFQYKNRPIQVEEGDRVRIFLANAGPSFRSDFHVVGTVFDRVFADGVPGNALEKVQTWTVPAGGGAVFETTFKAGENGEGYYPFVTHAFADAEKGAVGMIRVGDPEAFTGGH